MNNQKGTLELDPTHFHIHLVLQTIANERRLIVDSRLYKA